MKRVYLLQRNPQRVGTYRLLGYALGLFTLLLLITLGLSWLRWQELARSVSSPYAPPMTIEIREIAPSRVLPLLADAPAAELAWQSLAEGDPSSFQVLIGVDLDSTPSQRIGLLYAYLNAYPDLTPASFLAARRLYHTAVLHPYLSDAERLDALLYLAPRWQAWNQNVAFEATVRSVQALLQTSRSLRPEQRRRALRALRALNVDVTPPNISKIPPAPPALPPRLLLPFPSPSLPDDVQRAYATRRQAAQALARTPTDPERRARLAAALRAEHLARETFYRHALAATPTPEAHIALAWDRVRWRRIVLLVAQNKVGLSLVPEWEAERERHMMALIKGWENLVAQLADWVAAQPDILWADQGAYELWTWVAWAGEWGLYPRYPQPYVQQQIARSQERFFAHPDAPHRAWIVLNDTTEPPWYMLIPPME